MAYAKETIKYVQRLWGGKVVLKSKTKDGKEFIVNCDEENKVMVTDGNKI